MLEGHELAKKIAQLAAQKKAERIVIMEMKDYSNAFDYFVVVSGEVDHHVKAISQHVRKELSREGIKPANIDGEEDNKWVLHDYSDVILHVFDRGTRDYYSLEDMVKKSQIERIS